ncbi:helicase-related protein [Texas Phoenix palm phytoplasma]|uniref:helicase-related protein n=1 Tax=Texas Phoenix palm phytoplasma TaxID=176709 RepID=UPI001FF0077D|nr:DEAD/DEAH box helicase [Texas Phoenix palm phytoplasma]
MLKEIENRNSQVKIFYGSMNKNKISLSLKKKQPPIIITTIEKLFEYSKVINKVNINKASYLVLDEADTLFEQKFLKLLDILLQKWNPKILLFSSSIREKEKHFIKKYFGKVLFLDVFKEQKLNINYYVINSLPNKKINDLIHFLKQLNPFLCFIFVSKKKEQFKIYEFLKNQKFNILNFCSDLSVKKRKNYILEIKKMKYQYVLTSDLTARGLDLDISWIIHYDLPNKNLEFFQHRSGRTGRMGKSGNVVLLYEDKEKNNLEKIKKLNQIVFKKIILKKTGFIEQK